MIHINSGIYSASTTLEGMTSPLVVIDNYGNAINSPLIEWIIKCSFDDFQRAMLVAQTTGIAHTANDSH